MNTETLARSRSQDCGAVAAPWMRYFAPRTYTNREEKAPYIAAKYRDILGGSVLDVGCDQCYLRRHLRRPDLYIGVDLGPPADVVVNLDLEPLPFADGVFDTVVCTDVLEHLERIHAVFDGLCRIAREHVIISLPAPLNSLLADVAAGREGWKKFYGLPLEPPADRHRWFFGFEDARLFMTHRAKKAGWRIEQLDTEWHGGATWKGEDGVERIVGANLTHGILWCVLEREH